MDRQKRLRNDQERPNMSAVGLVDEASAWAEKLVLRESRGPGDLNNAMHRISKRHGVPYTALWRLRYRRPKDVMASIYFALQAAYEAERARQLRALQHEIEIEKAAGRTSSNSVRAAQALLDSDMGGSDEG